MNIKSINKSSLWHILDIKSRISRDTVIRAKCVRSTKLPRVSLRDSSTRAPEIIESQ